MSKESTFKQAAATVPEGFEITIMQLDVAIGKTMDPRLIESGKWPLLLDETRVVSTFLRYRNCICLDAMDRAHMEAERIRSAIIGAIRFGKPLVLDLMQANMFDTCTTKFDDVQPGLMQAILDKSIVKDKKFMELVKDSDGELYASISGSAVDDFRFAVLVEGAVPPTSVGSKMYPVKVTRN